MILPRSTLCRVQVCFALFHFLSDASITICFTRLRFTSKSRSAPAVLHSPSACRVKRVAHAPTSSHLVGELRLPSRPCELTTGPSTFTHGSERGLAPHPAPSDRHGQGACGPALGRAHRRMSPPARDELHVLSVCDRALIPLLDELRDERVRRA